MESRIGPRYMAGGDFLRTVGILEPKQHACTSGATGPAENIAQIRFVYVARLTTTRKRREKNHPQ